MLSEADILYLRKIYEDLFELTQNPFYRSFTTVIDLVLSDKIPSGMADRLLLDDLIKKAKKKKSLEGHT